jgi:hypothetical protein
MLHYPTTSTGNCKYCGAAVTLQRRGDGRPGQGRLNYWYTTEHHCPEADRALQQIDAERRLVEEALFSGP